MLFGGLFTVEYPDFCIASRNVTIKRVVSLSKLAVHTLKRRFKPATGLTLIEYVQN